MSARSSEFAAMVAYLDGALAGFVREHAAREPIVERLADGMVSAGLLPGLAKPSAVERIAGLAALDELGPWLKAADIYHVEGVRDYIQDLVSRVRTAMGRAGSPAQYTLITF